MSEVRIDEVVAGAVASAKGKRGRKRKHSSDAAGAESTARKQYIPPIGSKWSGTITVPDEFVFPPITYFDCPASYFASRASYYEVREVIPCRKQAEEYAKIGDAVKQTEEYKRRRALEELQQVDIKRLAALKAEADKGNIDLLQQQLESSMKMQEELLALMAKMKAGAAAGTPTETAAS